MYLSIFSVERKETESASLSAKDWGPGSALRGHRTRRTRKILETECKKSIPVLLKPSFTSSDMGQHWIKTVAVSLLLQSSDSCFTHLVLPVFINLYKGKSYKKKTLWNVLVWFDSMPNNRAEKCLESGNSQGLILLMNIDYVCIFNRIKCKCVFKKHAGLFLLGIALYGKIKQIIFIPSTS